MKKVFTYVILSLIFFIAPAFFVVSATEITPTVKDLKTVKVGVYDNYPKIYKDADGNIKGFWADITNDIANKENWKLEYVYDTWDNNLKKLENQEIDIMVDVAVSEERKSTYDFNNETALVSWGIFYTKNGVVINSYADLEGKKIAIMKSGILYSGPYGLKTILNSFGINAEIIDVSVYSDVFKLLNDNEADVGVVNWFFGIANQADYKVNPTNLIFYPSDLKYALPKNAEKNNYLISVIDFNLKNLKDDPTSIYHQSIKASFGYFTEKEEVVPVWVNVLLIGFASLAVLVAIGFLLMRRYQKVLAERIGQKIKELEKSELRYKDLYESLHDAVVTISPLKGEIVSGNNSARIMFGVKKEDKSFTKSLFDYSPEYQKDGQTSKIKAKFYITKALESEPQTFEWLFLRQDGKEFPASITLSKIELGKKSYLQATIKDITELKEAERKVADLNMCRNKFISVVSHQVRTPLTAMKWNLETLLDTKLNKLTADQSLTIQNVLNNETEAIKRIDDMLEVLDIEEGKSTLNKTVFEFDDLLRSVIVPFKTTCKIKQIYLEVEIEKEANFAINADMKKFRIILEHLTDNAVSYTNSKGNIKIILTKGKKLIRFEITDTGVGIPESEQLHIFEGFFRASNAALIRPDASGLGLKISKFYIEQHKGTIGFSSIEEKGSTFWFEIPTEF